MHIPIYQVDAFAEHPFEGNPAAVCPMEEWLPDEMLQQIAMENNLSETAFFVRKEEGYRLRWFTPATEVDLCGHATLASAHVLFKHLLYPGKVIRFYSNSGELQVRLEDDLLVMDFPTSPLHPVQEAPSDLSEALGVEPKEVYRATDYLYVVESRKQVASLIPDLAQLAQVKTRGVIVTAPGAGEEDFVSRFFGPAVGVDEDPVTGSAHTMLTPYWSHRLDKKELIGRQLSSRGGLVYCSHRGERVELSGEARTYLKGDIYI